MEKSLDMLRDRAAGTAEFRRAARDVCAHLMQDAGERMRGDGVDPKRVIIVVILRAALAFLDAAMHEFPDAPVGVLGLKRDERTLLPHWYYENLPPILQESTVVILDPMLATGGSVQAAVEKLAARGADPGKMYFVSVIAAPEGVARLEALIPRTHIMLASTDTRLDPQGMIVPGLGDFGDRYFGHAGHAIIGA